MVSGSPPRLSPSASSGSQPVTGRGSLSPRGELYGVGYLSSVGSQQYLFLLVAHVKLLFRLAATSFAFFALHGDYI